MSLRMVWLDLVYQSLIFVDGSVVIEKADAPKNAKAAAPAPAQKAAEKAPPADKKDDKKAAADKKDEKPNSANKGKGPTTTDKKGAANVTTAPSAGKKPEEEEKLREIIDSQANLSANDWSFARKQKEFEYRRLLREKTKAKVLRYLEGIVQVLE